MSFGSHMLPVLLLGAALVAPLLASAAPLSPEESAAFAVPADRKVTLSFRGPLRDALQAIAKQSGINVVATGPLDTEVEVHLQGVLGEQALRTLARAHALELNEENGLWTLRARGNASPPLVELPALPPLPPLPKLPPLRMNDHPPRSQDTEEPGDVVVHGRNHTVEEDQVVEDVVLYGGNLNVEGHAQKDAAVFGGNLHINGHVEGDAVAVGGNLFINGHVEGDAHAFGGNVELGPDAEVEGDVSAFGGNVTRADGSRVGGTRESFHMPRRSHGAHRASVAEWLGHLLIQFALMFGLGFLFFMFAPARMKQLGEEMMEKPVACGLTGVLSAIALAPLIVLLCVTLVGIPVVLAMLVVAPIGVAMGVTSLASELGARLPVLRGRKTQAVVLALGTGLLVLLFSLPKLGVFILAAALLVSLGALVRTRFGNRPRGIPEPLRPAAPSY